MYCNLQLFLFSQTGIKPCGLHSYFSIYRATLDASFTNQTGINRERGFASERTTKATYVLFSETV